MRDFDNPGCISGWNSPGSTFRAPASIVMQKVAPITVSVTVSSGTGSRNIAAGFLALKIISNDGTDYTIDGNAVGGAITTELQPLPHGYAYPAVVITGNVTVQEVR